MELLNTKDAARMLGVAPGTLRYWRSKGVGPACFTLKDSTRVAYRRDEIESYISESEQSARVAAAGGL